jgi:hypothetical protein
LRGLLRLHDQEEVHLPIHDGLVLMEGHVLLGAGLVLAVVVGIVQLDSG